MTQNVFLIPTEKWSPLVHSTNKHGGLFKSEHYSPMTEFGDLYQHMYIISDEKPAIGDWSINRTSPYKHMELCKIDNDIEVNRYVLSVHNDCKKVILTTDIDLIKNGVQAIDEEFIDWFIKSPERVSVRTIRKYENFSEKTNMFETSYYKTIIPQTLESKMEDFFDKTSVEDMIKKLEDLGYTFESKEKMYTENDMKQYAWRCVANFLSNNENKLESKLADVIIDRNNNQFEQFKNK